MKIYSKLFIFFISSITIVYVYVAIVAVYGLFIASGTKAP